MKSKNKSIGNRNVNFKGLNNYIPAVSSSVPQVPNLTVGFAKSYLKKTTEELDKDGNIIKSLFESKDQLNEVEEKKQETDMLEDDINENINFEDQKIKKEPNNQEVVSEGVEFKKQLNELLSRTIESKEALESVRVSLISNIQAIIINIA